VPEELLLLPDWLPELELGGGPPVTSPSLSVCHGFEVLGLRGVTGEESSPFRGGGSLPLPEDEPVPESLGVSGARGSLGTSGVNGARSSSDPLPLSLEPLPLPGLLPEAEPAAAAAAAAAAADEPIAACWPSVEFCILLPALARSAKPAACSRGLLTISNNGMAKINASDK